ncbi:hypothetical protein F4806DRAFT_500297 [Annulohypoxylon nitens]|nr:hypothetical protein F4806DRAFT_500297 [Annulohypoxylon nitens]
MSTNNIFVNDEYEHDDRWTAVDAYAISHLHPDTRPITGVLARTLENIRDAGMPNDSTYPVFGKYLALQVRSAGAKDVLEDHFDICREVKMTYIDPVEALQKVIRPYVKVLKDDPEKGFKMLMEVDQYSTREYLRVKEDMKPELIEYLEWVYGATDYFRVAFSKLVLQMLDFSAPEWKCIKGVQTASPKMRCMVENETKSSMKVSVAENGSFGLSHTPAMKAAVKFSRAWWTKDCHITKGGIGFADEPSAPVSIRRTT